MRAKSISLTAMLVLLAISLPSGKGGNTGGQVLLTPTDLQWVENAARPGQRSAGVLGDQLKPGPYVRRVRFPPNTVNPPHSHPDDRQVTILSGTWYLGHGSTVDKERATTAVAGSFFTEPANNVHWEITGAEEVIVQVSGTGPTATNYVK